MNCIDTKNRLILDIVYPEGRTLAESRWIGFDMNAEMVKPGIAGVYDRHVTHRGLYQVPKEAQSNIQAGTAPGDRKSAPI